MFGVTAAKFYAKQTYKQLNKIYRPTWLPNEPVEIGDIGLLQRGVFRRIASLGSQVGGTAPAIRDDPSPSPLDVTYSKSTKLVFKAAGETKEDLPNIPSAKAGFGVEFSRKGAFTVRARESYEPSIENIIALRDKIVALFAAGKWDKNWSIVVKKVRCPAATILISKSSSTKLEFSVSGDVPASGVVLGSADISFQLEASTNQAFNFVDARDVTPFVQLMTIGQQAFDEGLLDSKIAGQATLLPLPAMAGVTPEMVRESKDLRDSLTLVPASDPDDSIESGVED